MRDLLKQMLSGCARCNLHFLQNVGLILDEPCVLNDAQVKAAIIRLNEVHKEHGVH